MQRLLNPQVLVEFARISDTILRPGDSRKIAYRLHTRAGPERLY
jgi:hypothetical protein